MKQRLLAGLLAVVLVLGLAPAALAAAPAEEEAAQVLAALDIMVGDESGNLNLGATVTRAEFTKLAVAASTSRDAVGDTVSVKPYPDVPQSHWAAPYIKAAVDLGLVQGDLHGNFNPGRSITLAEGVTIVLRLLGYQDSDFTGVWPSGQMAQYRALKLNEGVTAGQDSAMTRRDALYLFYNLMITKNKEGSYYLNVLDHHQPGECRRGGQTGWPSSTPLWRAPWWPPLAGSPACPSTPAAPRSTATAPRAAWPRCRIRTWCTGRSPCIPCGPTPTRSPAPMRRLLPRSLAPPPSPWRARATPLRPPPPPMPSPTWAATRLATA
ncbi:MAG: S-layer homology domain-containing protein [Flavonifractor plautii]